MIRRPLRAAPVAPAQNFTSGARWAPGVVAVNCGFVVFWTAPELTGEEVYRLSYSGGTTGRPKAIRGPAPFRRSPA